MSADNWKPGDVAIVDIDGQKVRAMRQQPHGDGLWTTADRCKGGYDHYDSRYDQATVVRPLLVVDPEDRDALRAIETDMSRRCGWALLSEEQRVDALQAAVRSLVSRSTPDEPTDPKAIVTDRRDNIWRLLADGDWVCTSGPDVGEYLNWDQLAGDRGPVAVTA